jgi:peptide/nickel transport system permease protein
MLNSALATPGLYFTSAWTWLVLPAGFAISLAVLGFTFLGAGLEPIVNPRWRR